MKKFVDETMLSILSKAGNPNIAAGGNTGVPTLISYLRNINMSAQKPSIPNPPTLPSSLAGVRVPNVPGPKRASRGLVYPGAKPTKSPLYKFLR